jgi:hypothetical protein
LNWCDAFRGRAPSLNDGTHTRSAVSSVAGISSAQQALSYAVVIAAIR